MKLFQGFLSIALVYIMSVRQAFAEYFAPPPSSLDPTPNQEPLTTFTNLILSFLSFVSIVAVIYILWAGFQILIGGQDEKAIDRGKKTIINVIIGIIIMWLAYAIVSWIISALQ